MSCYGGFRPIKDIYMRVTPLEEVEKVNNLVLDYQKTGNIVKRNDAIVRCMHICKMVSGKLSFDRYNAHADYNDLIQEAGIIVMNCCEDFNIEKCSNFFAYVTKMIRLKLVSWFPNQNLIRYKGGRQASFRLKYLAYPKSHSEIEQIASDNDLEYDKVLEWAMLKTSRYDDEDEFITKYNNNPSDNVERIKKLEWFDEQLKAKLSDKHINMLLNEEELKEEMSISTIRTTNMRSRNKLKEAVRDFGGWDL